MKTKTELLKWYVEHVTDTQGICYLEETFLYTNEDEDNAAQILAIVDENAAVNVPELPAWYLAMEKDKIVTRGEG